MGWEHLPATFTAEDVAEAGYSRSALYKWRKVGRIVELSRGVYRRADAPETTHLDVLAVAKRVPRGIACLVTALVLHDLTDEIPPAVQFAIPRGVNPPRISYPPTEISRFDPVTFEIGRQELELAPGEMVPVYSPERAVADAMRLRHRVGDTVALRALRAYLARNHNQVTDLLSVARQVGDSSALINAIQVMVS